MELLCIVDDHCSFVDVKNSFTLRALHHRLSVSVDFLYHQGDFRILTDDNSDESKETKKKRSAGRSLLRNVITALLFTACY